MRLRLGWALALMLVMGCSADDAAPSASQTCVKSSDCAAGLVCLLRTCTQACAEDRDCAAGARCLRGASGVEGCVSSTSAACTATCDDGAVCASDRQCRTPCDATVQLACLSGQACIGAVCRGTDPGHDPAAGAAAGGSATGGGGGSPAGTGGQGAAGQGQGATHGQGGQGGQGQGGGQGQAGSGGSGGGAQPLVQVALGYRVGCATIASGTYCWGDGGPRVLPVTSVGQPPYVTSPVLLAGGDALTSLSVGLAHACGVRAGQVICWGEDDHGQCGQGDTSARRAPHAMMGITSAVSVLAGDGFTCALLADHTVQCSGVNDAGQLGTPGGVSTSIAGMVPNVSGATAIVLTGTATAVCALHDKQVRCWGSSAPDAKDLAGIDDAEQIWGGTHHLFVQRAGGVVAIVPSDFTTPPDSANAGVLPGIVAPLQIVDDAVTCVLDGSHSVSCGKSDAGVMLDPLLPVAGLPAVVTSLAVASNVTGSPVVCATSSDGTVDCWGGDAEGMLGIGSPENASSPRVAKGLSGVKQLAMGITSTAALLSDGSVVAWGRLCGVGVDQGANPAPLSLPLGVDNKRIAMSETANDNQHVYAITATGDVTAAVCGNKAPTFGLAAHAGPFLDIVAGAELDLGLTDTALVGYASIDLMADRTIVFGAGATKDVTAGLRPDVTFSGSSLSACLELYNPEWAHACAVSGGALSCWGSGDLGKSTPLSTSPVTAPQEVTLPTNGAIASMCTGDVHTCVALASSEVYCFGGNAAGQLGDPTAPGPGPVTVPLPTNAVSLACGANFTCAALSDGSVHCWGGSNHHGYLGVGSPLLDHVPPTPVPMLTGATAVFAQTDHICAIHDAGAVSCWGENVYGQLGDGETGFFPPTKVAFP